MPSTPAVFTPVGEGHEVKSGAIYRSSWYFVGNPPPGWMITAAYAAVSQAAKITKRFVVVSQEVWTKEQVAVIGGPHGAWLYRIQWKKQGEGTPLLFFTGPAGIITLAIVGVVALTVGAVIVLRQTEESLPKVGEDLFGLAVAGALIVLFLGVLRR